MNLNGDVDGDVLVDMVVNTCGLHAETCMCMFMCPPAVQLQLLFVFSINIQLKYSKTDEKRKPNQNTFTHRV